MEPDNYSNFIHIKYFKNQETGWTRKLQIEIKSKKAACMKPKTFTAYEKKRQ